MSYRINTNAASLSYLNALNSIQDAQRKSMERLTSGRRINRAADDVAGLAISQSMTSQIRGTNQALKNINDGISYVQTGEGALNEVSAMLQRIRELAVQNASGTYTDKQKGYIDTEFDALKAEIQDIIEKTKFNGKTILTDNDGINIQTGWQDSDSIIVGQQENVNSNHIAVILNAESISAIDDDTSPGDIGIIDAAMDQLNSYRANLGAHQNRLEYRIENLAQMNENISSARSQIMDTDFAFETAELAKHNILQQTTMYMLAQALKAQENILIILRN